MSFRENRRCGSGFLETKKYEDAEAANSGNLTGEGKRPGGFVVFDIDVRGQQGTILYQTLGQATI